MKKVTSYIAPVLMIIISSFFSMRAMSQTEPEKLKALILHKDSLFWNAYNNCGVATFKSFVTDDVEFYHDNGGITIGATALAASIKNNLCSKPDYHLRREAVPGTVKVFLLEKSNVVYGAVITGEHYFYLTQKDKIERKDGWAKFTQLWIFNDNVWKMSRILSYDHAPAPMPATRKEIELSNTQLAPLEGEYTRKPDGKLLTIKREGNRLVLFNGGKKLELHASAENNFFIREMDMELEFVKKDDKVSSIKVIENGKMMETMMRK
jgi:hypothetical protein